jgi:hypothetical protein
MPVPTNLEEALALLTTSASNKITAAEHRDVTTWTANEIAALAAAIEAGGLPAIADQRGLLNISGDTAAPEAATAAQFLAFLGGGEVTFNGLTLAGAAGGALSGGKLVAFSPLLDFGDHVRMVFAGNGSEICGLGLLAGAVPVEGATAAIFIPANQAGSLVVGSELNPDNWAPHVPGSAYLGFAQWTNGRCVSSGHNLGTADTEAPTVDSATVSSDEPSQLVLVFSKPAMRLPDLTGLSLPFSAGTPRTISSILSGQFTNTLVLALSGGFAGDEVCSLVVASDRTAQDLNGNLLTVGSTVVDVDGFSIGGALPGATHVWRGDDMTAPGGAITAVADQVGSLDLAPNGVANPPTTSTMGTNSVACWLIGASQSSLSADPASGETMSTGTMACVVDLTNESSATALMSGGADGSESALHNLIYRSSSGEATGAYLGGGSVFGFTSSMTGIHDIVVTWTPAGGTLYTDGVATTTFGASTVAAIGRWVVGAQSDRNGWCAAGLKFRDFQITNTNISGGDAAAYHAFHAAEVGY